MEKTISEISSLDKRFSTLEKTKLPLKTFLKIGGIVGSVGFITLLHYQTASDAGIRHVIFRELYFLPIILSAFWYGLRGGLSTALAISLLYGPLILSEVDKFSTHNFGNILEILLFILILIACGMVTILQYLIQHPISNYLTCLALHETIQENFKIKAGQRLLNLPVYIALLNFCMWLLLDIIFSPVMYNLLNMTVGSLLYNFFMVLMSGLIASFISFFLFDDFSISHIWL